VYGLNDLVTRLRTLEKDETPVFLCQMETYIDEFIAGLSTFVSPGASSYRPLTGTGQQNVILALNALRQARDTAIRGSVKPTAEGLRQAAYLLRRGDCFEMSAAG